MPRHGDQPIECDDCDPQLQYGIDRNSPLGLGAEYAAVEMAPQMSDGMRVPGVWLFTLIPAVSQKRSAAHALHDPGDDDEQYSLQERNQCLCVEALARADWNGFVLTSSESAGGYALRRRGVSEYPLQERNQYLCAEALARTDWNGFVLTSSESAGGYALGRRGVSVQPCFQRLPWRLYQ